MRPIIKVEGLSKQYRIGGPRESFPTLRDAIAAATRAPLDRLRKRWNANGNLIWALSDVNFEVRPGEVVGIIGRNGAGKSTLLKILSRITEPTTGRVELYGRVGSLLEVGTGFHPELTGRDNIFLNGAILGMPKTEITRKFDEIVRFAELEKFVDTPVKRYSSGMYVRLAFAVAAYLESDILIVDEVLAVGDFEFQKRCLGKMQDITNDGRTVLFVSHNMAAVKSLCTRAMLLEAGQLTADSTVAAVVDAYVKPHEENLKVGLVPKNYPRAGGTGEAFIRTVSLTNTEDENVTSLYLGQPFAVTVEFEVIEKLVEAVIEIDIATSDRVVTHSSTIDGGRPPLGLSPGRFAVRAEFDMVLLPLNYSLVVGIHHFSGTTVDYIEGVINFRVLSIAQSGRDNYRWANVRGFVRPATKWNLQRHAAVTTELD